MIFYIVVNHLPVLSFLLRMNFLSNILREEGGFEYKKAIVDSIVILIRDIPDAKESGLLHLCEFIEDCEFTYLSTQVGIYLFCCFSLPPIVNVVLMYPIFTFLYLAGLNFL